MVGNIIELPPPSHVGVVVRDIKKTSEYYSSMWGLGPWKYLPNNPTRDQMIIGEPFKLDIYTAQYGPVVLELLQPIQGKSVWAEFLKAHGEGLHHVCHAVPNFDEVTFRMKDRGAKQLVCAWFGSIRWTYFETTPGGLVLEIIEEGAGL